MLKALLLAATATLASAPLSAAILHQESGTISTPSPIEFQNIVPLKAGTAITARFDLKSDDIVIIGTFDYTATVVDNEIYESFNILQLDNLTFQVVAPIVENGTNFFGGGRLLWSFTPVKFDPETLEWNPVDYTLTISDNLAAVPEPATWALMIGGFGMAGASAHKRRARPVLA